MDRQAETRVTEGFKCHPAKPHGYSVVSGEVLGSCDGRRCAVHPVPVQCRALGRLRPCKRDGQVGDAVGMAGPLQIIKRDQKAKVHQKAKNKTKQNPKNNSQQFNRSNIPFIFLKVKLLRIFQG